MKKLLKTLFLIVLVISLLPINTFAATIKAYKSRYGQQLKQFIGADGLTKDSLLFVSIYDENGQYLGTDHYAASAPSFDKAWEPPEWVPRNFIMNIFLLDEQTYIPSAKKFVVTDHNLTGPFHVYGGTYGKDYTYSGDILRLTSGKLTVSNVDPSNGGWATIEVGAGVEELTLKNVNLDPDSASIARSTIVISPDNEDLTIHLAEGSVNTLSSYRGGIEKSGAGKLTIDGTGTLNIKGSPGIGSLAETYTGVKGVTAKNITINSGVFNISSASAGIGGDNAENIVINGGDITINSRSGEGIGGITKGSGITINGGSVKIEDGRGVGIGGGDEGENIHIGGTAQVSITTVGVGIGGKEKGHGIRIDGQAKVYVSSESTGIGGGEAGVRQEKAGDGYDITITENADVTAISTGDSMPGIGGMDGYGITISGSAAVHAYGGGTVRTTNDHGGGAGIGGACTAGVYYFNGGDTPIIYGKGHDITITGNAVVYAYGGNGGAGIGGGYSGSGYNINILGGTVYAVSVPDTSAYLEELTLMGGAASGGNFAGAGIGGGAHYAMTSEPDGYDITITNAKVEAYGGSGYDGNGGAGIGGGAQGIGYNIKITDSEVTAAGGEKRSDGIGDGGKYGNLPANLPRGNEVAGGQVYASPGSLSGVPIQK